MLHRDPWIIVLDKPAGLPVHDGPSGGDHLERYLDALRFGYAARPQLAHRLDRDTSGCLALGRHRRALKRLGRLFEQGAVAKTYWAVVAGVPPALGGTIDEPIARTTGKGGWRMVIDAAQGRPAITDWQLRASDGRRSWLVLRPRTGRTHQLRLHCATAGWPIVGDGLYGGPSDTPLLLHARALSLPMQADAPPVRVEAPPPAALERAITALGAAV